MAVGRSENRLTIAAIATFHQETGPFFVLLYGSRGNVIGCCDGTADKRARLDRIVSSSPSLFPIIVKKKNGPNVYLRQRKEADIVNGLNGYMQIAIAPFKFFIIEYHKCLDL